MTPIISLASVAHASEDPDFFGPSPTQVVYSPVQPIQSTMEGMRSYVWPITIGQFVDSPLESLLLNGYLPTQDSKPWSDLAAHKLTMAFEDIAGMALASATDRSVETAWPLPRDPRRKLVFPRIENAAAVCRAHQEKPSLVLPAPYYEDVQYCVRLISGETVEQMEGGGDRSFKMFRLQAEVNVTLTRNPKSAYCRPTAKEIAPFKELLEKLVRQIRIELETRAESEGWHVMKLDNSFDIAPASFASKDPDFSRPSPAQIVYAPTWEGKCPPHTECGAPERAYIFDVYIHIVDAKDNLRRNFDLEDRAAKELKMAFGGIAREVLASRTDAVAFGWQDLEDTVCRAHQKKFSLVLPAPYFEDVEYCFQLIDGGGQANKVLRLQASANVTLAMNPKSGYHEPNTEEITPFKELLANLSKEIRAQLEKSAKDGGWQVTENGFGFDIRGLSK